VLLGKRTENPYFISKYMVFYLLAKFFHFTSQRKGEQENVRFIINEDTVLFIVDYGKVIVNTFERDDMNSLTLCKSFNMIKGQLIMKEVGYTNFTLIQNQLNFK
jgi:hypothetical protein